MSQTEFQCCLCSKNFTTKYRLNYHLEHNVCQKPRSKKCSYCGHLFKNIKMLEYHLEHRVCQKKKPKLILKTQNNLQKENESLKLEIATLRGENKTLKEHPQTVNNTTNYNQVNVIVDFDKENIDDILRKLPNLLKDTITQHLTSSVPFLTKEIHCNPSTFPEYSNVFITKYNSPYAMVFKEGRFQRQLKKQTLDDVIEKIIHMLGNYLDDHDFNQKILDRYERYRDSIEHDGKNRADLEDELIGILIDYGEVCHMDQISKQTLKDFVTKLQSNKTITT
jgi:hypothetical protein